jgi:TolB-like protein/Tfp pilus assembly protein PilF
VNLRQFFSELQRRHVYRVAVTYAVVAWLLIQIATQVFPFFDFPNWAVRLVVLVLVLGFPVAIILAWAFDLTPEGIKRTEEPGSHEPTSRRTGRRLIAFVVVMAALGLAFPIVQFTRSKFSNPLIILTAESLPPIPEKSMAVLPFKPLSESNRDVVLELGMADTLIAKLSASREIIVTSLTAVRKYDDLKQDPVSIGRLLRVNSVLEGNLQRLGDRIRVTARLIKVLDGSSLWTGTFDEKFTDIFALQDAISEKVAAALSLRLSQDEQKRLTKRYTENVAAYQLYLMGRYHWNKLIPPEIKKSIGFFQQAIDLDPSYALAYFGLAEAYRSLAITSDVRPKDAFPQAKAAALKALAIDESLAEPHSTLAMVHMWFDWDWVGAEMEAKRAISLNPNSGASHLAYAHVLSNLGRHAEAIAEGARARELDPVSLIVNAREGAVLYFARRNDEARERLQKTLELDQNFWIAHLFLGHVYLEKKNYPEAIAEFTKARDFSRGNAQAISMIGYVSALAGDAAKARAILDELKSRSAQQYVPPCNVAVVHLALAEQDEAFAWLEKANEEHDVWVSFLRIDPKWDSYRSDPRFAAILKRIGLQ